MWPLFLVWISVCWALGPTGYPTKVSYDRRAFTINGTREVLISGSVHYPRSTPSEWPAILARTKVAGVDVIETYAFWNVHQPNGPTDWYFDGNADLFQFLDLCKQAKLFVNLRIGPYVCAEWTLGGIPIWVKNLPNIEFRDFNKPWMQAMGAFTQKLVIELVKKKAFAYQGGPVILKQIENEYGNVEDAYKNPKEYVSWAVSLAQNLTNREPWIMCQQDDAPNVPNLVNTCNGFYCDNWLPGHFSSRSTPAGWTENWPGWFQAWGEAKPHRPVQDISFAVARWFARGGSLMNYYMWQGGTTFGRHTGGPFDITSYDYDVALDEYGFPHEPKYTHSARLHHYLKYYSRAIVDNPVDPGTQLGQNSFVNVYGKPGVGGERDCVAFLSNIDSKNDAQVNWGNKTWTVPAWSVTILGGCEREVFNTARVPKEGLLQNPSMYTVSTGNDWEWTWFPDTPGIWDPQSSIQAPTPLPQVKLTNDTTDYLWYVTSITTSGPSILQTPANDIAFFYVNGQYQGMARSGNPARVQLNTAAGTSTLAIMTQTVGLINYGPHYEIMTKGIAGGRVLLNGQDITNQPIGWYHQIGLQGESLQVWGEGEDKVIWNRDVDSALGIPLIWWKALFLTPKGPHPLALDFTGATKGFAYINGWGIGRFWNITAEGSCPTCDQIDQSCDYRGAYDPSRCRCDCGVPSQQFYHVPREWLRPEGHYNSLIFIDEIGLFDPTQLQLVTRK